MSYCPKWLATIPIAHRGLHNKIFVENTLPAFRQAVKQQYAIELDVQLSKDKQLVVFHDYDLLRLAGKNEKVAKLSFSELQSFRLQNSDATIPALQEVFDIVRGQVPILIEIKNEGIPGELEKLLCIALDGYEGEVAVESFNPLSLLAIKKRIPGICTGQLSCKFSGERINMVKKIAVRHMFLNWITQPDFIAFKLQDLPSRQITRLREKGAQILGWTISTKGDLITAQKYCDNIIFEGILPKWKNRP